MHYHFLCRVRFFFLNLSLGTGEIFDFKAQAPKWQPWTQECMNASYLWRI